jgi:hypothetical protein
MVILNAIVVNSVYWQLKYKQDLWCLEAISSGNIPFKL